jgi:hypothetical protein
MSDIQFTTGVFREFRATVTFHLGKLQQDVRKDTVVEFDGTTLKMDGTPHAMPELRSAIKAGWLALQGANVSDYVPQAAGVRVRSAQDTGKPKQASTSVQQDETLVGAVHKEAPAPKPEPRTQDGVRIESKKFNPTMIKDTEGDGRSVGPATRRTVTASDVGDASEGQLVAKIKTPTKRTFSMDGVSMNEGVEDVTGVVEHVKVAREVIPEDDDDGLREGQSSDGGRVVVNVKTSPRRKVLVSDAGSAASEVHRLDNQTRVAVAPRGGPPTAFAANSPGEIMAALDNPAMVLANQRRAQRLSQIAQDVLDEDEEQVQQAPAPKAPPKLEAKPPKSVEDFAVNGDDLELAPGFRWNKKLHWKVRVKMALQYRTQPEKLALIMANEVESVVKSINATLGT